MERKNYSITIFYPSKVIGGAQILFLRIALKLIQDFRSINVIDFDHGYISTELTTRNLPFTFCNPNELEQIVLENTVVFTSANKLVEMGNFKPSFNCYLLFYFIEPLNLISIYIPWKIFKSRIIYRRSFLMKLFYNGEYRKLRDILKTGMLKKGIIFMDELNYSFTKEFYDLDIDGEFIPIPIDVRSSNEYHINYIKPIVLGTVCRLEGEKMKYLENLIVFISHNLSHFKLIIIGDGSAMSTLKKFCKNHGAEENVSFVGRINNGKHLDEFLLENINLGIAMGTSVLEFAKLKIPVLVTGPYFKCYKDVKYLWFFNTSNYDLAYWSKYKRDDIQLIHIMNIDFTYLKTYGDLCYQKVINEFNLELIYIKIKNTLDNTLFSLAEILPKIEGFNRRLTCFNKVIDRFR